MKNDLAMAYKMRKMARGGQVSNPKLSAAMCAHGGPIMCSQGCYAEGGEVEADDEVEGFGPLSLDDDSDLRDEQAAFDEDNIGGTELDNQKGMEDEPKKSKLLSRIMSRISAAHRGE